MDSAAEAALSDEAFTVEFVRNQLFLEARAGDQTGFFMLDTGAPTLLLAASSNNTATDAVEGKGVFGTVSLTPHTIESFWIGKLEQGAQSAYLIDMEHFSQRTDRPLLGMIGYEQLKVFEVFIDARNQRLKFFSGGRNALHAAATPRYTISFEYDAHLPILIFHNGDQALRLAIDTGAGSNLLHVPANGTLPKNSQILSQRVNVSGLEGQQRTLNAFQLPDLQLGALSLPENTFLPADLSQLQNPEGPTIDGIIGMDLLQQLVFSIDFKKRRFHVW